MTTNRTLSCYNDILEPRRQEISNFLWVSRKLDTALAYKQNVRPKPETHKDQVLESERILDLIEKISKETGTPKAELVNQVKLILDEIGFNKQLKVIRWLGLALAKICQKVYTGIYVNEDSIQRLKSVMGNCPVIFAPSHRSYADFILMSYILFTYDIEIPSIAAGMDFHGMWGMGSMLRDTGAFFMRRTYNDDQLYWDTFKQYVHQIVTKGDLPIEFFIEGTRSRSCKSLPPKYGLLSMMMKPFFTGEVPDILIVPINISYSRVLEEKLFAFELVGVPKPKESTSGFFKSLSIIKEHYGKIYVDFTTPISAKQYFATQLNREQHSMKPLHQQELTGDERVLISDIAYETIHQQQKHTVLTTFNLAAVVWMNNQIQRLPLFGLQRLQSELLWFQRVLEKCGALVSMDVAHLDDIFEVHGDLICINQRMRLELRRPRICVDQIASERMKAHHLTNETMTQVVPELMLQLYINPCLHYLIDCCFMVMIMIAHGRQILKDDLFKKFQFLRSLYANEFVFYSKRERMEFEEALQKLIVLELIEPSGPMISLGNNQKLETIFINLLNPFISSYSCVCRILQMTNDTIEHHLVLIEAQKQLESALQQNETSLNSYCLSLDTLGHCLQSLTNCGALQKRRENGAFKYQIHSEKITFICDQLDQYTSKCFNNYTKTKSANLTAKL